MKTTFHFLPTQDMTKLYSLRKLNIPSDDFMINSDVSILLLACLDCVIALPSY